MSKRQSSRHCACSHNWWRAWWNGNMEFRACWSKNKSRRQWEKKKLDAGTGIPKFKN